MYLVYEVPKFAYNTPVGLSVSTRTVSRNRRGRSPDRGQDHDPKDQAILESPTQAL